MSERAPRELSQSRIGTYLKCPRMYAYQYDWGVSTPDRTERYLIQGRAYHEAIEKTCESANVDTEASVIAETGQKFAQKSWEHHVDPAEFESAAQEEYYRRQTVEAISEYFDPDSGDGILHARRSIAVERLLETTIQGVRLRGYADNIVQTDGGLHIIDYKRNLRGVLSSYTAERLPGHRTGEEYEPGRVQNAIQAAIYINAVKDSPLYQEGWDVRFSFYGILYDIAFVPDPEGYSLEVRGREREVTDIVKEYSDEIEGLIGDAAAGIDAGEFSPEPWDQIRENTCEDCDYGAMCGDLVRSEVRIQ